MISGYVPNFFLSRYPRCLAKKAGECRYLDNNSPVGRLSEKMAINKPAKLGWPVHLVFQVKLSDTDGSESRPGEGKTTL
jgi:hypothetical protein